MKCVGTADLKAHLSAHLRAVRQGSSLTVLDRKTPIARLIPFEDRAGELVVRPARGSLRDLPVPESIGDGPDVLADLLATRGDRPL